MGKHSAAAYNVSAKSRKVSREIGKFVAGIGGVAFRKDIAWGVDELNKPWETYGIREDLCREVRNE